MPKKYTDTMFFKDRKDPAIEKLEKALHELEKPAMSFSSKELLKKNLFKSIEAGTTQDHVTTGLVRLIQKIRGLTQEVHVPDWARLMMRERVLDYVESSSYIRRLNVFERSGLMRSFAGAMLLFVFVLTSILVLPFETPITFAHGTTLDQFSGDVQLRRNNTLIKATPKMELREGDSILTQAGASATIRFFDDSLSRLGENTNVVLRRLRSQSFAPVSSEIELSLREGRMWTKVVNLLEADSSFRVDTSRLQAHVETKAAFDLHETEQSTEVAVFDNVVKVVSASATIEVPKTLVTGYRAEVADVNVKELKVERLPRASARQSEVSGWYAENLTSDEQYVASVIEQKEELIGSTEVAALNQPASILANNEAEQLRLRFMDSFKLFIRAQADLVRGTTQKAIVGFKEFDGAINEIIDALDELQKKDLLNADMVRSVMKDKVALHLKDLSAFRPGHRLYRAKETLQEIQLELAVNEAERAEIQLVQAESLLLEIEELVRGKKTNLAATVLERYRKRTNGLSLAISKQTTDSAEKIFETLINRQFDQIKVLTAIEQSLINVDQKAFREKVQGVREDTLRRFVIALEQVPYATPYVLYEVQDLYETYGEVGSNEEELIEPAVNKLLAQDYQVSFIDPSGQAPQQTGVISIITTTEATMDVAENIEITEQENTAVFGTGLVPTNTMLHFNSQQPQNQTQTRK